MGCKLIVVACNTATTNAVSDLRKNYDIPIIGIEPAVKPAALSTSTKNIGILATKGTLSSILFEKTSSEYARNINTIEVVGEGLVPLIEDGKIESAEMIELLQKYAAPMIEADIDYLVLGCSHYPYLIPILKKILPSHVTILDSGEAVARHTKNTLAATDMLRKEKTKPSLQFYTNAKLATLEFIMKDYSEVISIEKKKF
jgi:glutamate racemase